MKLCILGTALGTSDNLVINDDYFSWINYVPSDVVTLGSNKTSALSLDYVAKLFRKPIPTFGNLPHAKFFKSIGMEPHDVHWQRALDTVTYKETINEMIGGSRGLMDEYEKSGYSETLTKRLEVLSSLEKAAVNERELAAMINSETDTTQMSNLKTFMPHKGSGGFSNVPIYTGVGTSTGRMKIERGPQILTLRKSHRGLIKSSWENGDVISIDYSSLEPRVALALSGHAPEGDVYEWIDKEVFGGSLGRTRAKILTLSLIYGMSLHSARNRYGDIKQSDKNRLLSMFSVNETKKALEETDRDELRNYFGRPIFPDKESKLFNSYIQSTAVDVAMIGFGKIISALRDVGGCRPLFLIHDEIICDVPSGVLSSAQEIFRGGIEINLGNKNVRFPVTVEKNDDKLCE